MKDEDKEIIDETGILPLQSFSIKGCQKLSSIQSG